MTTKKVPVPLSVTHPELAAEANGWDTNSKSAGSNSKVSWMCEKGHSWEARIINRTAGGTGCPYCSGKRITPGFNDLATLYPHIAKEAYDFDPRLIGKGSSTKVNWKCPAGHIYAASPNSRTNRKSGCSICDGKKVLLGFNDLETKFPLLAEEADGWSPSEYTAGSGKRMPWICKLGHRWSAPIVDRTTAKYGCPVCTNHVVLAGFNDLETLNPELASEAYGWDPTKVFPSSDKKLPWICNIGHIYTARVANRNNSLSGCPYCSGNKVLEGFNDLGTTHPELARDAIGWDPAKYTAGANYMAKWKCPNEHNWKALISSRTNMHSGCPSCSKSGFDPNKDSYLYLIEHPLWGMLQVGITNDVDQRLSQHKRLGWEPLEIRGPMDGHLTQQWETSILRMIKSKGADLSNSKIAGKFDGYSEAWSKSTFEVETIKQLMSLTEEYEERE